MTCDPKELVARGDEVSQVAAVVAAPIAKATMGPPRGSPTDTQRVQLVRAAEQVLARDGFSQLNVRNVCRQAGTSTHRFYDYFTEIAALIAALLANQCAAAHERLAEHVGAVDNAGTRVWAIVDAMICLGLDKQLEKPASLFVTYWRHVMPNHRDVFDRHIDSLLQPLAAALAQADSDGLLQSTDPARDATTIYSLLVGMLFDRPYFDYGERKHEIERTVLPFLARGLGLDLELRRRRGHRSLAVVDASARYDE